MIANFLIATLLIFGLLAAWIGVQHWARSFAERHPEFGPAREDGHGCLFCLCRDSDRCVKQLFRKSPPPAATTDSLQSNHSNAKR